VSNVARISLHPSMTAVQIAEWCATHRMYVVIDYTHDERGEVQAAIFARREPDPESVPAFLRRQAE
jgi:hypothetical protein